MAISVTNEDDGIKQKCRQRGCHDSDSSNGKAAVIVSSHAECKRRFCQDSYSNDDNDAHSSGSTNHGGDNKGGKDCWQNNERHRHHDAMPRDNQQTEGATRGGATS